MSDMERDEVEALIDPLGLSFQLETDRIWEHTRKAAGLKKVLLGYGEMYPEFMSRVQDFIDGAATWHEPNEPPRAVVEASSSPRGADAVRLILQEHPNSQFRVSEAVAELRKRDNPANAVRAALERLVANTEEDVIKGSEYGYVTYSYQPDRIRPSDAEAGYGFDEEPF
jgi:hypothetical protein